MLKNSPGKHEPGEILLRKLLKENQIFLLQSELGDVLAYSSLNSENKQPITNGLDGFFFSCREQKTKRKSRLTNCSHSNMFVWYYKEDRIYLAPCTNSASLTSMLLFYSPTPNNGINFHPFSIQRSALQILQPELDSMQLLQSYYRTLCCFSV